MELEQMNNRLSNIKQLRLYSCLFYNIFIATVLPIFLCLCCKYASSGAKSVNARMTLKFSPIWIFNFPVLYDWPLKYGMEAGWKWGKAADSKAEAQKKANV